MPSLIARWIDLHLPQQRQLPSEREAVERLGAGPQRHKANSSAGSTDEFTDQEIEDAFVFIDSTITVILAQLSFATCSFAWVSLSQTRKSMRIRFAKAIQMEMVISYAEFYQLVVHPDFVDQTMIRQKLQGKGGLPPLQGQRPGDATAKVSGRESGRDYR